MSCHRTVSNKIANNIDHLSSYSTDRPRPDLHIIIIRKHKLGIVNIKIFIINKKYKKTL